MVVTKDYVKTTARPKYLQPLPWFEKFCTRLVPSTESDVSVRVLFEGYREMVKAELEYDESWTEEEIPEEMALASYRRFSRRLAAWGTLLGWHKSTKPAYRVMVKQNDSDGGSTDSPEPKRNLLPNRNAPRIRRESEEPREGDAPKQQYVKPTGPFQVLRSTPLKKTGCFALRNFKKNEVLCEFTGQIIPVTEAESRQKEPGKSVAMVYFEGELKVFCLDLSRDKNGRYYEDSENLARFINHKSHNPNCEIARDSESGKLYVRTRRGVAAGVQLFIDHQGFQ